MAYQSNALSWLYASTFDMVEPCPIRPLLTHRHVEVFRAVMTAGSVTGAAEALFTSQPTISRELSRMESLLRLALFDRVRGRLQPTAQAYALFDEVQRSYAGLERVADTALRLRQFTEGQLSLACLPAFSHALLPGACARFQAAHPGVSVSVNPYESPLLEERLAAQAHDLGLTEHDGALAGAQAVAAAGARRGRRAARRPSAAGEEAAGGRRLRRPGLRQLPPARPLPPVGRQGVRRGRRRPPTGRRDGQRRGRVRDGAARPRAWPSSIR